jgi:hypothetical protein
MHSHLSLSFNGGTGGAFTVGYMAGVFKMDEWASYFTNDVVMVLIGVGRCGEESYSCFCDFLLEIGTLKGAQKRVPSLFVPSVASIEAAEMLCWRHLARASSESLTTYILRLYNRKTPKRSYQTRPNSTYLSLLQQPILRTDQWDSTTPASRTLGDEEGDVWLI